MLRLVVLMIRWGDMVGRYDLEIWLGGIPTKAGLYGPIDDYAATALPAKRGSVVAFGLEPHAGGF
jgi:hypothetical protein